MLFGIPMLCGNTVAINKVGPLTTTSAMPAIIDRSLWSKSSQKSSGGHYDERASHYENISYRCCKCFAGCVFLDEAQKIAYEIEKKFVWWLPSLCAKCQLEVSALRVEDRLCQERWKEDKATLMVDRTFLSRWISVLDAIPTYGKKANTDMKVALRDCLESISYE
jgi:hypothetical protein